MSGKNRNRVMRETAIELYLIFWFVSFVLSLLAVCEFLV